MDGAAVFAAQLVLLQKLPNFRRGRNEPDKANGVAVGCQDEEVAWYDVLATDTVYRFGRGIKYREIRVPGKNGYVKEGPMSSGYNPHGRWTILSGLEKDEVPELRYMWYWYGDEVSEGEYRRRQREE